MCPWFPTFLLFLLMLPFPSPCEVHVCSCGYYIEDCWCPEPTARKRSRKIWGEIKHGKEVLQGIRDFPENPSRSHRNLLWKHLLTALPSRCITKPLFCDVYSVFSATVVVFCIDLLYFIVYFGHIFICTVLISFYLN